MVKKLKVYLIDSKSANNIIKKFHYSGKIVNNSKLHFGVFENGILKGAMSFGCPLDKNRAIKLVKNTKWGEMLELNRMAFDPQLPKNAESRCLAYALRFIKKKYKHIKWIQTFADACQCGDGTIYRAVGFKLIGIKKNTSLRILNGRVISKKTLDDHMVNGKYLSSIIKTKPLEGFQIKYIYFLDSSYMQELTCKILPFDEIERIGATMYKGIRASSLKVKPQADQPVDSGSNPTDALHRT